MCLKWFHVNCTDLSEEKFRILGNINGCFWACVHCRNQVVIPQEQSEQSKIKDELSQKIEDMKGTLKSEIESFKTEIRDCIRNAHTNMNSKISETDKQLSSKTPSDKNQIQKSENLNKLILFGVAEKPNDGTGTTSFVELISYDKKKVEEIAQSCGIDKIMVEDVFRLGRFDEAAQRTRPIVVKLTNLWNYRLLLMSNQKLKAQNIFVKAFLSKDVWEKEKKLLDYRFKLAQKLNINRSEIKIRSGALFVENQLVDITLSVEETCQKIGNQTTSRS